LREADATKKGDIGVENGSPEAIREALSRVRSETEGMPPQIDWEDLIEAGLIIHPNAAARRRVIGELLGIGYCNGKQLYKRLVIFKISREEFAAALAQLEDEGVNH
jgi:ribonuclease M5